MCMKSLKSDTDMSDADKAHAYKVLGLAPEASKADIDAAYNKLIAFIGTDESHAPATKELADSMRAEIESAYTVLTQTASTISDGTGKQAVPGPGGKGIGFIWAIAVVVVCGFLFVINQKGPEPQPVPYPSPSPEPTPTPQPAPVEPSPAEPPDFVVRFIHDDDVKGKAVRWRFGKQDVNGGERTVVWAFYDYNEKLPLYKFELYEGSGGYRLSRLYICRYSSGHSQVAVQRFEEKGSASEMADQSNVSDKNDVLVQTTTYFYSSAGKLDSVRVDTPFTQNKDGLEIRRYGSSVEAVRKPEGGIMQLGSNMRWMNNLFDLWSVFGEPTL